MRKLITFLTLLMLFLGTGPTWAEYSESNGVKTWDFTQGYNTTQLMNAGFVHQGGSHRYTISDKQAGGIDVEGLNSLMFSGTFTLYDSGGNLLVNAGDAFSIGIPNCQDKIVTVTGYFDTVNNATGTVTWGDGNGGSGLQQTPTTSFPSYGSSVTDKKPLTLGGVASGYWVGFTIPNSNGRPFHITKIQVYTNTPSISFSKDYDELDLISLDYTEPNLSSSNIPDGAVLSFRPSNWDMARIDYPYTGTNSAGSINGSEKYEIRATHKGYTGIIAEYKLGDVVICSAQFTLYISADDYTYEITNNGKTYTITGAGGIPNRVVDEVSFIEMQYGDAEGTTNLPIVRNMTEGLISTILDQNGWRHIWLSDGTVTDRNGNTVPDNQPYQGTFYIFKPQIDGKLTINMTVKNSDSWYPSKAVMVESTALTTAFATFDGSTNLTDYVVNVVGGKTYYLYALTPDTKVSTLFTNLSHESWSVAGLHSFTFEPTAGYFDYKGLVLKDGKLYDVDGNLAVNGTGQTLAGTPSGVEYTLIECLGDASATINSSTGVLTIDETKGGAIAVGAIVNGVNRDYYMITVPYTTHDWFFTESADSKGKLTHNDYTSTAWGFNYKVSRPNKNTRLYEQLKDAVLCNARDITGNNAGLLAQTAGLVFKSPAKRFGTNTTFDFSDYDDVVARQGELGDEYAQELHNIIANYIYFRGIDNLREGIDKTFAVTYATNTSLIIPNLKAGQYIRIWWQRHGDYLGDKYTAKNVNDLSGAEITGAFYAGNGGGYEEFIAKGGDAIFTLNDETANTAWTDLYRVTVGEVGEFLETSLTVRMSSNSATVTDKADQVRGQIAVDNPKTILDVPADFSTGYRTMYSIANDNDGSKSVELSKNNGTFNRQGNFSTTYAIGGYEGTKPTLSGSTLTVSGTGIAGVVVNNTSNGYVIDTDTTTIAYGVVEPREYPYTWDFTNVGKLTSTLDYMGNAADEGTGAQAYWYKKDGDPNKMSAEKLADYKLWKLDNEEYVMNVYHYDIQSVVFAQGTQLIVDGAAIPETQGLGIYLKKSNNRNNDFAVGGEGQDYLHFGKGYLKFVDTGSTGRRSYIRVPAVPAGAKVYLCASGESTVGGSPAVNTTAGTFHTLSIATDVEQAELASNDDGTTYVYENADGKDVIIDVTGLSVYKLAVTSTFKPMNDYNGKSYATESRDHNEKYDLSGYFTGKNINAYKVTGYEAVEEGSKEQIEEGDAKVPLAGRLTLVSVDVAPAATGVILVGDNTVSGEAQPLFVKDVNTNLDEITTNYMVPSSGSPSNPYILTTSYINNKGVKKTGPLAFYKAGSSATLGANKAWFDMPETSSANFYMFKFIDGDEEETDGIEAISLEQLAEQVTTGSNEFYNLNGQRINGKPTQRGIYICNGKKIFVK